MKVLVISDSHGNIANLKHVLGFGKDIEVGAVIHCGDWDTLSSIEAVEESGIPIFAVLGNADIDPRMTDKLKVSAEKFNPETLFFESGEVKIAVSHFMDNLKKQIDKFDIGFYGHKHSQEEKEYKNVKLIRPGALEKNINFVLFDTKTGKIEFINEQL